MENFEVNIDISEGRGITFWIPASSEAMNFVQAVSSAHYGCLVTMEMYGKIRRQYRSGMVVLDLPFIDKYYEDTSTEMQFQWSCQGTEGQLSDKAKVIKPLWKPILPRLKPIWDAFVRKCKAFWAG